MRNFMNILLSWGPQRDRAWVTVWKLHRGGGAGEAHVRGGGARRSRVVLEVAGWSG